MVDCHLTQTRIFFSQIGCLGVLVKFLGPQNELERKQNEPTLSGGE